ncbi:MAG: methyltransferase domain-containing protein [Chloroflexi bacterium]|nr:methyltransferase domain-containing protein [Chloroflexota bacterium]
MSAPIVATKKIIEGIFDRAAVQYDHTGPRVFEQLGARLVELMPLAPGAQVLDVATGRGAVLVPAAQRVGATGHVVGIDLAQGMLDATARDIARHNVELRKMDAEQLEFADASFDAVTCAFALFFFPAMDVALREMIRVCRSRGCLGVSLFGDSPAPFRPAWSILAEQIQAYGVAMRMPQCVVYNSEIVRGLLTEAGWTRVEMASETHEFVYATEEDWWQFQFTLGTRAALEQLDDATRVRFRDEYLAKLRPLYRADGLHLPVSVIYARAFK